ncbi:MAG: DUF1178 family protein [Polaromonas sp.]|nr:DUF1178 family protein [Polaromonas sp.]
MKVLNLQCAHQHAFEGWFASEDDFQSQLARGLVSCPMCADPAVRKMPSAPRLNLGATESLPVADTSSRELAVTPSAPTGGMNTPGPAVQAEFLTALRHVLSRTEDVGERFADEARAMHYGDAEQRSIRGQASRAEAIELIEEGIEVMPLPLPVAVKETLQ